MLQAIVMMNELSLIALNLAGTLRTSSALSLLMLHMIPSLFIHMLIVMLLCTLCILRNHRATIGEKIL